MRRIRRPVRWLALVLFLFPAIAAGQSTSWSDARFLPPAPTFETTFDVPAPPQERPGATSVKPMVLSLLLPGAGQHALGQRRKWLYIGLEALGWSFYVERQIAGENYRDRYRDFAWSEARIQSGPRIDGRFAYYETLTQWTRSGSFDTDPVAAGLQPELDPTTFNGTIWERASQIFLPGGAPVPETDPAYQAALTYYQERAYGTDFLWDWTGTGGAQQEFERLIEESDDRFRQATNVLGAVLANHVIAAADAYLSSRGRGDRVDLQLLPPSPWVRPSWQARLELSLPR